MSDNDYESDMASLTDRINTYARECGSFEAKNWDLENVRGALDGVVFAMAEQRNKLRQEIERLRAALRTFAETARGIPDNWPGECHLRIDSEPVQLGDFTGCREWLCYHGINDVQDACLPTIAQWRAARAAGGE